MSNKKYVNTQEEGLSKYLKDVRKSVIITQDKELELAKRIVNGDQKAIEELTKANLRFVISVAKDYQNQGLSLSDLISEGNYGLIIAAKRFDHTKGFRFISYAVWWIKQSIMQSLNENSRMVRLPANVINQMGKDRKEREKNVSDDTWVSSYNDSPYPGTISLNQNINENGDELLDVIPNPNADMPDNVVSDDESLKYHLNTLLSVLTEREKDIVECYFGLGGTKMTLESIGEEYGLTKERVRQIKEKAIKKLRHNSSSIQDFLNG